MPISADKMRQIREDVNAALASVAVKHGLRTLAAAKGSYGEDNFSFKLEGVVLGGLTPEAERYNRYRVSLELPALGASFTHKRAEYRTTGMNTTGSKIICRDTTTGKEYLFPTDYVRRNAA